VFVKVIKFDMMVEQMKIPHINTTSDSQNVGFFDLFDVYGKILLNYLLLVDMGDAPFQEYKMGNRPSRNLTNLHIFLFFLEN